MDVEIQFSHNLGDLRCGVQGAFKWHSPSGPCYEQSTLTERAYVHDKNVADVDRLSTRSAARSYSQLARTLWANRRQQGRDLSEPRRVFRRLPQCRNRLDSNILKLSDVCGQGDIKQEALLWLLGEAFRPSHQPIDSVSVVDAPTDAPRFDVKNSALKRA